MDKLGSQSAIWVEAVRLREELRRQHPEFDSLPYKEQEALWRGFLGLPNPPVPSAEDQYRDASCLVCHDTGWVTRRIAAGEKTKDESIPCPNCSDWGERQKQYQLELSGIPEAKRVCNFLSFKGVEGAREAFDVVYYLAKGEVAYKLVLIYGDTGNGKTHLAYAAVLEAIERGLKAQFWYVPDLFGEIRKAMELQGQDSSDGVISRVESCPFLALDDIGVRKETPWQGESLERIINYRYAHELPLIATTNKDPRGLGPAILDRFRDAVLSKMVLNTAPTFRTQKK
jgi:DNA replication protein DnaC